MIATFDGPNLTVQIPSTGSIDAGSGIYSAWKQWVAQSDNAKYPKAFDTAGGDGLGAGKSIAPYFFLRNDLGWVVRMPNEDGEIVIQGNLFPRNDTLPLYEQASGFDAFLKTEVSSQAIVVNGSGGLTPEQDANIKLIPALL